jgi:hypothetical protein
LANVAKCTTVGSIILRASRILNDDVRENAGESDYVRWPRAVLIDYLNEGVALLQSLRPDSFTENVAIVLKPGAKQLLPDGYDTLLDVLSNVGTDAQGNDFMLDNVREQSEEFSGLLLRYNCAESECASGSDVADFKITAFNRSGQDVRGFTVEPPVPEGSTAKVCVRAVKEPAVFCPGDEAMCVGVPRKHEASLVDWVLHRAWLSDIESAYARASSVDAHNRFYAGVETARLNEARHGSGYTGGQVGEGDPEARRR